MYKKQMTFQKIVCALLLIGSALVFIYSLGLSTDLYDSLYTTIQYPDWNLDVTDVTGSRVYYDIQPFNTNLTLAGLGLIIVTLLGYVTNNHGRRKYYVGNFVTIGLSTVANVLVAYWGITNAMAFKEEWLKVNFEELKVHADTWRTLYTESTFWFDVSYFVFGFLMLVTVLNIVNLVLKLIVMKEEKRLIGSRKDVRT